jgi:predicted nucleic acid-binding protein
MGLIFDTTEIISWERNHVDIDSLILNREDESIGISVITVSEILHGVERADTEVRKMRRQAFVEKVIEFFPVYPFDLVVARTHARIWASIAKKGIQIDAHDLIIAATAMSLGYTLITANLKHYNLIEGLRVEASPAA